MSSNQEPPVRPEDVFLNLLGMAGGCVLGALLGLNMVPHLPAFGYERIFVELLWFPGGAVAGGILGFGLAWLVRTYLKEPPRQQPISDEGVVIYLLGVAGGCELGAILGLMTIPEIRGFDFGGIYIVLLWITGCAIAGVIPGFGLARLVRCYVKEPTAQQPIGTEGVVVYLLGVAGGCLLGAITGCVMLVHTQSGGDISELPIIMLMWLLWIAGGGILGFALAWLVRKYVKE